MDVGSSSDLGSLLPLIGLAGGGVLLVALTAAAEMAFASVNRARLRQILAQRNKREQIAEHLLGEPVRLLSTLLLTKLAGKILTISSVTLLALRLDGGPALVWWLIGAGTLLVFAQLLPWAWIVGSQERGAVALAPLVRIWVFLLTPLAALMLRIGQGVLRPGASAESIFLSEDGLRFLLNVSDEETIIEDEEKEMIASIFEFSDKLVREVMIPRIDVTGAEANASMLEALDVILKAGHSRLPIYNDSIDNVAGILYAKDLLRYLRDGVPMSR